MASKCQFFKPLDRSGTATMNQKFFTILVVLLCALLLNYFFLREAFTDSGEIKDKGVAKMVSGFTGLDGEIPTTMGTQVTGSMIDSSKSAEEAEKKACDKSKEEDKKSTTTYVTQEALDSQLALQQKLFEAQTQKMLKDETLTRRATEDVKKEESKKEYESDPEALNPKKSLTQGATFQALTKDPKVVCPHIDPSKYIRRDQIPCWNCNLTPNK